MLVEINLLPQKERKSAAFIVIVSIVAALFVLATAIYLYEINSTKGTIASTEKEIEQTQVLVSDLQKQVGSSAAGNSVNQLKTAIDLAEKNRIETVPVMLQLTALLPERGFIQSFSYQESGAVSLTVQFDTTTEAAAYLNSLTNSSMVTSVSMTSLNPVSTNSGTASGSQTNSTNPASNSTSPTVDSNTTNSTGTAVDPNALPRYNGQYTIQLNQDAVMKAIEQSKKDGSTGEEVSGT